MERVDRFNKAYEYLKNKGMVHTQRELAKKMQATAPHVSLAMKGDSKYLTDNFIRRFNDTFGGIFNLQWLIHGEDPMLINGCEDNVRTNTKNPDQIRYWVDIDATGGGVQLFGDLDSNRYIDISIPEFKDCTDAVNLYGDSMSPLYKNGQIIILKKWTENFIDYGNVYLVVTRKGNRMVKYLRQGSDNAHVLCVSENKEYDSFEIEKDDILQLYIVKGAISKNTM